MHLGLQHRGVWLHKTGDEVYRRLLLHRRLHERHGADEDEVLPLEDDQDSMGTGQ